MIDVLLALAGLLAVSLVALSCCGPPGSSKVSFNGSSHDRVETALDRGGSRKITVIEAENINHDVKEKTLEDERKKTRERINRSRTAKSNNRSNQEQLPRRRKARDDRDGSEKPSDKGGGGGGVRRKATKVEKDPLRPVSSSDPFSKQSDTRKVDRETDGDDASTKEAGTGAGGSKTPMDDSQKGGGGSRVGSGLPSTERVGTNETMVSRERADELESSKLKKEREAKTPAMQSNDIDSDSKKAKLKTPPKPKRRLSKRKEEEVRQWNEAIARGNVFRPRKDDETVDEVHIDWNG